MAPKRLKLHQIAGKDFTDANNHELVKKAKALVEDELQGYRNVSIDPKGRLYINTKTNPVEENQSQQIISLLMAALAETEALKGKSMAPVRTISPEENRSRRVIQETIGRGLIHPKVLTEVASRGFRHPSRVSTDDLSEKFLNDIYQRGHGYDPETGAAFTMQDTQSGHKEDDNLRPDLGHSIDNIAQQSRIVNQVTADSAKNRSNVSPKYKSISDLGSNAIKQIQDQYKNGYKDIVYTDDGDSDIYGSALDALIKQTRSDLTMDSKRFAAHPKVRKVLMQGLQEAELRDQALNASTRIGSEGDNRPRVVNIEAEGDVTIGDDVLGNGNGNGKKKRY